MRSSWSHKLKRDSSEKTTWCQSACQALCSCAHCRRCRHWFADLRSNPGEDMAVWKYIGPSWHGGILINHQSTSSLVRLVEMEERWYAA
ncbi:hypothetical protein TNCV_4018751 [Trichonephila clavipes]|nr:hypothetical protein TNCV_4018751 [Trichonephila clavipes]